VVIDKLASWRGRKSPLNSDEVLDELAEMVKQYGNPEVISDQYCGELIKAALSRRGVTVRIQTLTNSLKSDIFASARRAVNREAIELLDHPLSIEELCSLEVTPTSTGKPRIQAARGHHDDLAMVVVTLIHSMRAKRQHADVGESFAVINTSFVRHGDRPAPFNFGGSGREPIQWSGGVGAAGADYDPRLGHQDDPEQVERHLRRMEENTRR
jgi:hypothetical protein